jgi:hypothetical protein
MWPPYILAMEQIPKYSWVFSVKFVVRKRHVEFLYVSENEEDTDSNRIHNLFNVYLLYKFSVSYKCTSNFAKIHVEFTFMNI